MVLILVMMRVGMAKVMMVTRNNGGVDGGSERDGSMDDRRRW